MWRLDREYSAEARGTTCALSLKYRNCCEKHIAVIVCVMGHGTVGAPTFAREPISARHTAPGLRSGATSRQTEQARPRASVRRNA